MKLIFKKDKNFIFLKRKENLVFYYKSKLDIKTEKKFFFFNIML